MMTTYERKKATVARQRALLSDIYELTQDAPPMVFEATMDKHLDATSQDLEYILLGLATTLEQTMHLWDENYD